VTSPEPSPEEPEARPTEQPPVADAEPVTDDLVPPPPPLYGYEPPAVEVGPSLQRRILVPIGLAVALGVLGVGIGWLWALIAPRLPLVVKNGAYYYGDAEPEQPVAADGWFLIIGIVAGIVLAVAVWLLLRRYRGVGTLVALTLGSVLGGWVAWYIGYKIGLAEFKSAVATATENTHLNGPLKLGMTNMDPQKWWRPELTGVVMGQALSAALVYTALAGFSAYDDLRTGVRRRSDDQWAMY
jgi:hypothetical protein